ncbi:AI-2E family transporter [Planosporangium sp. 12N6]|uniref:AI-2E family transporter n=1 Tax=Planosporangium spinosum TaxID=3402278 RepID=UPI003CE69477
MSGSGGSREGAPRRRRVPTNLLTTAIVCGCVLVIAATVFLVGWILVRLGPVTLAAVAALLLTALLDPVADALHRLRLPRWAAALCAVLLLLAFLILPLVLIGRHVATQFDALGRRLDEGIGQIRRMLTAGPLPISGRQIDAVARRVVDGVREALPRPVTGAALATEILGAIVLALILVFFLLKDADTMWRWALARVPSAHRRRVDRVARAGWDALTGYVRATVIIAAADAVGIGVALLLVGVPLALPLVTLTFVAAFVPLIGATVAGAAAVLVALVANGPTAALIILVAVIVVQQTEGNLLEPLVMGRSVRLHPAVILIAVSAGTVLAGIAGAVVAVPVTAVVYRMASALAADGDTDHDEPGRDNDTSRRDHDRPGNDQPGT